MCVGGPLGRVWLERHPNGARINRPARKNEIDDLCWIFWPLDRGKAGTQHGTKCIIHPILHTAGVASLALRVGGVMHRHSRRFGHHRHPRMRKGQHDRQRKHKADEKQQMADSQDTVSARHQIGLGREPSQIKSRLGISAANWLKSARERGKASPLCIARAFGPDLQAG